MPMLSQTIYNPVIVDVQSEFRLHESTVALTVSLPILCGNVYLCYLFFTVYD
jgi:hypothetical protein